MRWLNRKSALKRWIEKHRQESFREGTKQVVLAFLPQRTGYLGGGLVFWLEPVLRIRQSTSWKPTWCLDSGHHSWWTYEASNPRYPDLWREWRRTRPIHHLAGLINFIVYWPLMWLPIGLLVAGFVRMVIDLNYN